MKTLNDDTQHPTTHSRRTFLRNAGIATAATLASTAMDLKPLSNLGPTEAEASGGSGAQKRRQRAYNLRKRAAHEERAIEPPPHTTNGDEDRYSNFIGNYSKGLPHNSSGEVDPAAYQQMAGAS